MKVHCAEHLAKELWDFYSYYSPGYFFNVKHKLNVWDGKIRLFNMQTRLLYRGLASSLEEFAKSRSLSFCGIPPHDEIPIAYLQKFVDGLDTEFPPYEFQFEAFCDIINKRRGLFISPTGSGKTFIAYMVARWFQKSKKKTLIICPNIQLIEQAKTDFIRYNKGRNLPIHTITGGKEKSNDVEIVISTWQSVFAQDAKWFNEFDAIIGDEAHGFTAASLKGIMEKATKVPVKVGITGTLDGKIANEIVLEGLFGPKKIVTTYEDLIDKGRIPDFKIRVVCFKHTHKFDLKQTYQDEIKYLVKDVSRNQAIGKLCSVLEGNILVLFGRVDTHGKPLHKYLQSILPEKHHKIVHGGIDKDDRIEIVDFMENNDNVIACCSYKTFSTGISCDRIHHVVFASPSKSTITVVQSIGRGLRKHETKESLTVWDLADYVKMDNKQNHTYKHMKERIKIYASKNFKYTLNTKELVNE